jgi:hypothetical protein
MSAFTPTHGRRCTTSSKQYQPLGPHLHLSKSSHLAYVTASITSSYLTHASASYLIWIIVTKPFTLYTRRKPWRRLLGDAALRNLIDMDPKRLKYVMGTTLWVYSTWAKWCNLQATISELGNDARLLWIGPKKMENVILYLHGKRCKTEAQLVQYMYDRWWICFSLATLFCLFLALCTARTREQGYKSRNGDSQLQSVTVVVSLL